MNPRFAHVLSRLSFVSVVAVSALGAAACNGSASTTAAAPAPAVQAEAAPVTGHAPGQRMFKQVYALDLRAEQRAAVSEAEQNLLADLSPHRETIRQVVEVLVSGIESGKLDPADAAAQQAALVATVADARVAIVTAMNAVHDTLDAGQRATLVARLEEQHRNHTAHTGTAADAQHDGPMARFAFELGLSEEQKQSLRDAMQKGADEMFPDHAARREANQARMKALGEAFIADDFDAATQDLGAGAERSLESFVEVTTRAVEVSGRVLSVSQREALAGLIRTRAARL